MFRHDKHFFSAPENVGVILNTDAVPLFKSSSSSVWPVYLEIANLPPHLRFRHDNTITCGLWVGKKKPNMATLLEPTLKELNYLSVVGFQFNSPVGLKTVRVKALFGVFDMIAKASVLNMKQFNGRYGCPNCLHPGVK